MKQSKQSKNKMKPASSTSAPPSRTIDQGTSAGAKKKKKELKAPNLY